MLGGGRAGSSWWGHVGICLHLENGSPAPAPLKRNELPRKRSANTGTSPVWWAGSPKLTREAQPWGLEAPWGGTGPVPRGEADPRWEEAASAQGWSSSWVGARQGGGGGGRRDGSRCGQQTGCCCNVWWRLQHPVRVCSWGNLRPAWRSVCGLQAARPGGCWHLACHLQLWVQPQVSGARDITAFVYRSASACPWATFRKTSWSLLLDPSV